MFEIAKRWLWTEDFVDFDDDGLEDAVVNGFAECVAIDDALFFV